MDNDTNLRFVKTGYKLVTKQDLENNLKKIEQIVQQRKDSQYGVFGPNSITWKIGKESILTLGSAYALMMQTAHPWIAYGVQEHSKVKNDPLGRAKRTFQAVDAMLFGDLNKAFKYSRMTFNIHSKIHGKLSKEYDVNESLYYANDEDALMWVAATLAMTSVLMYETFYEPLSDKEINQYYEEFKLFCYMFGISDNTIPKTWKEFGEYYNFMCYDKRSPISVKYHARDTVRHFLNDYRKITNPLMIPVWAFMNINFSFMPQRIIDEYKFNYTNYQDFLTQFIVHSIEILYPKIPLLIRKSPTFRLAMKKHRL